MPLTASYRQADSADENRSPGRNRMQIEARFEGTSGEMLENVLPAFSL